MAVKVHNLPAQYTPGTWTALVTGNGTALLHPDFDPERVRAVWAQLTEGGGLSGCLEVLATGGFTALPAFALVQHDEKALRVLVRGDVTIASGRDQVDASGIATWRESILAGPDYTITTVGSEETPAGLQWPIAAGIVSAAEVEWFGPGSELETALGGTEGQPRDTAAGSAATEPEPVATPEVEPAAEPESDAVADPAPEIAPESEPEPAAETESEPEPVTPSLQSSGSQIVDSLPWDLSASRSQAPAQDESVDTEATVHPHEVQSEESQLPAEAEQTRLAAPEPPQSDGPEPQQAGEEFPEETVLSPHALRPRSGADDVAAQGGMDAPPAQAGADAVAGQEGAGDVDIDGDHDGETIMVSELPQRDMTIVPEAGDLYDEPDEGPVVLGLALSTGVHVDLDRPVLIGRAPESARFDAGVQPRLVTVPSPQQDISRTHVEIRAEGSGAVVTDLNSTNGTILMQTGASPRRLHGGESASVPSGTTIDLGDGITMSLTESAQAPG